jgi:ABC-2 type transport system permease protein
VSAAATMLKRIYAVLVARNREFVRDRGTLAWNILMPVILVFGLAFVFGGEGRNQYTVGVLQSSSEIEAVEHPFLESRFI